jgi:hypothetical protein
MSVRHVRRCDFEEGCDAVEEVVDPYDVTLRLQDKGLTTPYGWTLVETGVMGVETIGTHKTYRITPKKTLEFCSAHADEAIRRLLCDASLVQIHVVKVPAWLASPPAPRAWPSQQTQMCGCDDPTHNHSLTPEQIKGDRTDDAIDVVSSIDGKLRAVMRGLGISAEIDDAQVENEIRRLIRSKDS